MADFSESKKFGTKIYPVESDETSGLMRRCEPILTPELLKSRFLKGLDFSNYSEPEIKQEIELAMNNFELESNLNLTKIQFRERIPFDRQAYKAFVFFKLNNGPILSIEEVLIESSNGEAIYSLPADWVEMGFAHKRQINLIPILSIFGAAGLKDGQASNAGLIFIQAVNNFRWLPAFYTVTYTCGVSHKDGQLPIVINNIIGMSAAIEMLDQKQQEFRHTATSVGQDGISQSASGPGPQTYQKRIERLEERKRVLVNQLKKEFHQKYYLSNL